MTTVYRSTHRVQPIERFPTKPRRDGRFQKRIRGVLYYFGADGNRKQALAEYDRVKHALYEGRGANTAPPDDAGLSLKDLAYRFLDDKLAEAKAGRLTIDWYKQHVAALQRFARFIGEARTIASLTPDDFAAYGRYLAVKLGSNAYNRERSSVLAMFNHAEASDWIERPVKIGPAFKKVSASVMRDAREPKRVTAGELIALLSAAPAQLQGMLWLGINGGFGGTDCGKLTWDKIDVDAGMIRSRRSKSAIRRDTPLWPQTLAAMLRLRASRPHDGQVFRPKRGGIWNDSSVAHQFGKLRDQLEMSHLVFSDLRHTFATQASGAADFDAKERVMGHKLRALDDVYVGDMFEARLRRVVDHVRAQMLLPFAPAAKCSTETDRR